jgi:hypothetical protein
LKSSFIDEAFLPLELELILLEALRPIKIKVKQTGAEQ